LIYERLFVKKNAFTIYLIFLLLLFFIILKTLNASGRSECTKHALKCGAGSGIFFLVQECIGLIIHGHKAAYIHSPYVDSHGETPQYRGRPLNLDLKRYESLHEMWRGHLVRERVITERVSNIEVKLFISNLFDLG